MVAPGAFSLAISYVVPVAATLAAGTTTMSPLHTLSTPTLEFPALRIPAVSRHPQTPAPALTTISTRSRGALSPLQRTSAGSSHAPALGQIVTNAYTTRSAPARPKADNTNLPVYEDAIGAPPPAMPTVNQVQAVTPMAPATDTTSNTASGQSTTATETSQDGWRPVYAQQAALRRAAGTRGAEASS